MSSGVMAVRRAVRIFRRSHACRTRAPAPMPPPRPHPQQPQPLLSFEARPPPWLAGRSIHLRRPLCRPGTAACPNLCGAAVALFEQRHVQRPHTSIRIAAHGRRGEAMEVRIYNGVNLRGGNSNGDADLSRCPPRRDTTRTQRLCASEEPVPPPHADKTNRSTPHAGSGAGARRRRTAVERPRAGLGSRPCGLEARARRSRQHPCTGRRRRIQRRPGTRCGGGVARRSDGMARWRGTEVACPLFCCAVVHWYQGLVRQRGGGQRRRRHPVWCS
ncbi:hypothetical protein BS78_09G258300 [Paspalum vaginatum]|nr:hypothetical protein BS78_09G258300 [Paspalum vaginatum]